METPRVDTAPTALVVATESDWIGVLGREIEAAGLDVTRVADPNTAVRWLDAVKPSLLVLDGSIPRLMLFRLYAALREQPETAETPIIFTRHPDLRAGRDGPDFYLAPNADPTALAGLVREALSGDQATVQSPTSSPEAKTAVVAPAVGLAAPSSPAIADVDLPAPLPTAVAEVASPRGEERAEVTPVVPITANRAEVEPAAAEPSPAPAPSVPDVEPRPQPVVEQGRPVPAAAASTSWAERPARRRGARRFEKAMIMVALALFALAGLWWLFRGSDPAPAARVTPTGAAIAPVVGGSPIAVAASPTATLIPPSAAQKPTTAPATTPSPQAPILVAKPTAGTPVSVPKPQQTSGIRGRVVNGRSYEPVSGVTVDIAAIPSGAPSLSMTSDGEGRFEQTGLPAGGYLVRAAAPGFRAAEGNVGVFSGAVSTINLLLEPD